jgi:microcystin-dependent protein
MDSYIGSIYSFGFDFAPVGWALCNGQTLPVAQNEALYSLLGIVFGGDGQQTFGVPNLQGRVPIGTGQGPGLSNYVLGQMAGSETVTLTGVNLPAHTHPILTIVNPGVSNTAGESGDPSGNYFGLADGIVGDTYYSAGGAPMATNVSQSGMTGSGMPVDILNQYITVNYCICTEGLYPSRN